MIHLPWPLSGVRLKSFWFVMSICIGFIVSYPFSSLFGHNWLLWALMITVVVSIPGVIRPQIASFPYRLHYTCMRIMARLIKEYLIVVCFCIMSIALGKKMHSLDAYSLVERQSHWISRESLDGMDNNVEKTRMIVEVKSRGLVSHFMQWARHSGYWWTFLLLPFFALLSVFEKEEIAHRIPKNIYTLY